MPRNPHASWSLEPFPQSFVCAVQTADCSAPPAHSRPQGCEKQGNFGPAKPDIFLPFGPPGCSRTPLVQESLRAALEFYITSPIMELRLIRRGGSAAGSQRVCPGTSGSATRTVALRTSTASRASARRGAATSTRRSPQRALAAARLCGASGIAARATWRYPSSHGRCSLSLPDRRAVPRGGGGSGNPRLHGQRHGAEGPTVPADRCGTPSATRTAAACAQRLAPPGGTPSSAKRLAPPAQRW